MNGRCGVRGNTVGQYYRGGRATGNVPNRNGMVLNRKDRVVLGKRQGDESTTRRLSPAETKAFVLGIIGGTDGTTDI